MGRPVVATDHGGARETVRPGETGWLVPPGDAKALADAISAAIAMDATARAKMATVARAHVVERFTAAQMRAATIALYQDVLGLTPQGPVS